MATNHYLKLFTGDYLRDTRHLKVPEHGAYLLLLMQQWDKGPIPNDDAFIARVLGMRLDVWKKMAPAIREFFTVLPDGRLAQMRLEAEREKVEVLREKRAEAGSQGGQAKSLKIKDRLLANAGTLPEPCLADATIAKAIEEDTGSLRSPDAASAAADMRLPPVGQQAVAHLTVVVGGAAPSQPDDPYGDLLAGVAPPEQPRSAKVPAAGKSGKAAAEPKEPRGHRLPDDWQPSAADRQYALEKGLDVDRVAEDFRDFWHARSGEKGRMANWSLTWKRRCRMLEDQIKERQARGQVVRSVAAPAIPAEVNGYIVHEAVEQCCDYAGFDYDHHWRNKGFTLLIVDALRQGKDLLEDIYPLMKQVRNRPDREKFGAGWFRAALGLNGSSVRAVA